MGEEGYQTMFVYLLPVCTGVKEKISLRSGKEEKKDTAYFCLKNWPLILKLDVVPMYPYLLLIDCRPRIQPVFQIKFYICSFSDHDEPGHFS